MPSREMTCAGSIPPGSIRMLRTACSVIPPGAWCPKIEVAVQGRDVDGPPVDVRRDDARPRVQVVAADQARDRHLVVALGEVQHHREHADVHVALGDVLPPARVDREALVVQDAVLQVGLLREQAVDQAREPDGAVVVTQCDHSVGERRVARVGERRRPRVGAAAEARELEGERAEAGRAGRDAAVVALGARSVASTSAQSTCAAREKVTSWRAKLSFSRAAGGVGSGAARFSHTVAEGNAATSGSSAGAFGAALCFERACAGLLGQRRTCDVGLHCGDLLRGRGRGRARHGPRDGRGAALAVTRVGSTVGRAGAACGSACTTRTTACAAGVLPATPVAPLGPEAPVAPVAAGVDPSPRAAGTRRCRRPRRARARRRKWRRRKRSVRSGAGACAAPPVRSAACARPTRPRPGPDRSRSGSSWRVRSGGGAGSTAWSRTSVVALPFAPVRRAPVGRHLGADLGVCIRGPYGLGSTIGARPGRLSPNKGVAAEIPYTRDKPSARSER